ncbi:MAG: hypothetical protein FJ271_29260 [Planctomycetes bacterium]|nr:hypothetical protein [Planctomycetota bacterium]
MKSTRLATVFIAVCCVSQSLRAELPLIRLDRVFPLGGQAGSTVEVEISGRDMEEVKELRFDQPGLKASFLKPNRFKVAIAADVPDGTYELRAIGKYGISGVQLFQVSRGLTEVADKEPNDLAEKAQQVPMNAAVNGHSDGNGDDFFSFPAKKGQRVTIDCRAFRLNSALRAILTLSTTDGKQLLQSRPYYNLTDPFLDFTAPADGDYLVRLHDMTFQGGLPYRLVISDQPHIENAFPTAVVPGEKAELTLTGRNLPGGKVSRDEARLTLDIARDGVLDFRFRNHLPSPSLTARGIQLWPDFKNLLNPVTLFLADAPVTLDQEANDTPETAQAIALPTVISGRFDKPGDADWFTFKGKAGETFTVDLLCERLDFPGDPFVLVFDAKGNELASFDDHGINFNALAQFNRDGLGTFRVPSDGQYRIFVQERYRNGGPRYQYVLRIVKAEPDFFPVVVHETPNEPTCPTVRQGGAAHYDLCLNRREFNGPVTIEAEGLPPGVTCPPVHVSPQTQTGSVVFLAAADAPEWSGVVKLKAHATIDGKKLERAVRATQRRWPIANINTSIMLREIGLAVRSRAPYGIRLTENPQEVAAGSMLEFPVTIQRHWDDFKGKVQLNGLNLPPGFGFATVDIAADKTEANAKLTIAGNVPPGDYSVVLRGDAQVPFNRDTKATSRPNVRVADPSSPLWVRVAKKK